MYAAVYENADIDLTARVLANDPGGPSDAPKPWMECVESARKVMGTLRVSSCQDRILASWRFVDRVVLGMSWSSQGYFKV